MLFFLQVLKRVFEEVFFLKVVGNFHEAQVVVNFHEVQKLSTKIRSQKRKHKGVQFRQVTAAGIFAIFRRQAKAPCH